MRTKSIRTIAVVAALALLAGALLAGPAEAKKKKKKKPKGCAVFTPWADAADAELVKVTDAATEDAPVEVTLPTEMSAALFTSPDPNADDAPHAFVNAQVDSAAPTAKLFARVEFLELWDYDLYMRDPAGTAIVYAAGFNQAPYVPGVTDGTGSGGHSEQGAEQIDGVDTPDCAGYTADVAAALTSGGDVTVKFWLGE